MEAYALIRRIAGCEPHIQILAGPLDIPAMAALRPPVAPGAVPGPFPALRLRAIAVKPAACRRIGAVQLTPTDAAGTSPALGCRAGTHLFYNARAPPSFAAHYCADCLGNKSHLQYSHMSC
ncbi:MAG: hypothetical protein LBU32_19510 [Clostridiales bacterium]|nr:hypothetical protein [Clostridiales bacterium]